MIGDWQHGQAPTKAQDTVCKLKNMQMDGPGGVHALAFVGTHSGTRAKRASAKHNFPDEAIRVVGLVGWLLGLVG